MKQTITFAKLSLADYKGDVKKVYETAYGITVNIADKKTGALKAGCTLTSTAASSSRRNGNKTAVTFDSKVASLIITSETNFFLTLNGLSDFATRFNGYFKDANTALGKTVTAPAKADITWAAATSVQLKTGFGKDLSDAAGLALGIILGIVFGVLALVIILIILCCYCCCKKKDSGPPAVVMVTAEQPAGAKYMKNGVWYDENDQAIKT